MRDNNLVLINFNEPKKQLGHKSSSRQDNKRKMKGSLIKQGRFFHYKDKYGKWKTTKQTTREEALIWVQRNINDPQRERELGIIQNHDIYFKDLLIDYLLKEKAKLANDKQRENFIRDERCLKSSVAGFFGHYFLWQISPELIEDYQLRRLKEKKKTRGAGTINPHTINREVCKLSAVLKQAVKDKKLKKNPVKEVQALPTVEFQNARAISFDEFLLLKKHFNPQGYPATTEMFECAFLTGRRPSDLRFLRWMDVNLEMAEITLWSTKTQKKEVVKISEVVKRILSSLKGQNLSEYVFPNREGKRRSRWAINSAWDRARKNAGMATLRFYDLRHSFVSICASMGLSWEQTSEFTGHKTYEMYRRYKHLFDKDSKKRIDKVQAPFLEYYSKL